MRWMTKKSDIRLGQLLVQKKHCSLRQVNEALLEQKHLRTRNENVPVGRLLVDRGVIDEDTLREVLAEMGVLALHCPACRVAFPAATYQRGSKPACPQCGGELALNDRPVDAEAPASSL